MNNNFIFTCSNTLGLTSWLIMFYIYTQGPEDVCTWHKAMRSTPHYLWLWMATRPWHKLPSTFWEKWVGFSNREIWATLLGNFGNNWRNF